MSSPPPPPRSRALHVVLDEDEVTGVVAVQHVQVAVDGHGGVAVAVLDGHGHLRAAGGLLLAALLGGGGALLLALCGGCSLLALGRGGSGLGALLALGLGGGLSRSRGIGVPADERGAAGAWTAFGGAWTESRAG